MWWGMAALYGWMWGCALPSPLEPTASLFSPPLKTTVASLHLDPRHYWRKRIEVSGQVEWWETRRSGEVSFWHFYLKDENGDEMICYSDTYKKHGAAWFVVDNIIRRAQHEGKDVTVVGYLDPYGTTDKIVIQADWIIYKGHWYNMNFVPPAVDASSVGYPAVFTGVSVPSYGTPAASAYGW